jgi:hypothetical protein
MSGADFPADLSEPAMDERPASAPATEEESSPHAGDAGPRRRRPRAWHLGGAGLLLAFAVFVQSSDRRATLDRVGGAAFLTLGSQGSKRFGPEQYGQVVARVLPQQGYTLPVRWGDLGPTLVRLGVIDLEKLERLYRTEDGGDPRPELRLLREPSDAFITITTEDAWLLVTVFWGLGLAQKSPVLDRMAMERSPRKLMSLASTGGWTLGAKPAAELYSKFEIVRLTADQHALVADLAHSIHRPCCNNATAFADCNHGMALLGVLELMAAHGVRRDEMLRAALKFNAFWFPQQYTRTALLFALRGDDWETVSPREILGPRYSSLEGWTENVDQELTKLSHLLPPEAEGASCALPR